MKLILNDNKITTVQEFINTDVCDSPRGEDFVITQDAILEIQSLLNDYFRTAEKAKEAFEILQSTPACKFAETHEQNVLNMVDNLLTKKELSEEEEAVKQQERQKQIDLALAKHGIVRPPEQKSTFADIEETEQKYCYNNTYKCYPKNSPVIYCAYRWNEAFNSYDFQDLVCLRWYKDTAFEKIEEVKPCSQEDIKIREMCRIARAQRQIANGEIEVEGQKAELTVTKAE